GFNIIYGTAGSDTLYGLGGDDELHGGAGSNTLSGGEDDDTYFVESAGDVVIELPDEGDDTVKTTLASYPLTDNVENLTFSPGPAIGHYGVGNDLDNKLIGQDKNDVLYGGAGNDKLDGGLGADFMVGQSGDDTYYVDNAGDTTNELANDGRDVVVTTLSSW